MQHLAKLPLQRSTKHRELILPAQAGCVFFPQRNSFSGSRFSSCSSTGWFFPLARAVLGSSKYPSKQKWEKGDHLEGQKKRWPGFQFTELEREDYLVLIILWRWNNTWALLWEKTPTLAKTILKPPWKHRDFSGACMNNLISTQEKERAPLHLPLDFTKHLNHPRNWKPSKLWLYRHEGSACKTQVGTPPHPGTLGGNMQNNTNMPRVKKKVPPTESHRYCKTCTFKRKLLPITSGLFCLDTGCAHAWELLWIKTFRIFSPQ